MVDYWVEWSEVARNLAIVLGGGVGLWLAWSRTRSLNKQTATSELAEGQQRREHLLSLFESALEKLNSDKLEVRLGAVYILQEVMELDPDRYGQAAVHILANDLKSRGVDGDASSPDTQLMAQMIAEFHGLDAQS